MSIPVVRGLQEPQGNRLVPFHPKIAMSSMNITIRPVLNRMTIHTSNDLI